jgi:AcrR family transcriptional regulator
MPRDTFPREQIIQAAVDTEGVDGLNMRRLGVQLGAAATAVYWHVKSKDDLVVLAADHVWGEIELPERDRVAGGRGGAGRRRSCDGQPTGCRHGSYVRGVCRRSRNATGSGLSPSKRWEPYTPLAYVTYQRRFGRQVDRRIGLITPLAAP